MPIRACAKYGFPPRCAMSYRSEAAVSAGSDGMVTGVEPLLEALRTHWGLHGAQVRPWPGGMNSQTWLVRHQGSKYVAKRVPQTALAGLARGCQIASQLAEVGFVTGRPVPTLDGEFVVREAGVALLEHVPGRELDGASDDEQRWIAGMLGGVHAVSDPVSAESTATFFTWLTPEAPGVEAHPWLATAISAARAETDPMTLTWSVLHTDPAPQAFRADDRTGVTGLIDWTGAQRGPVLYDVASAVMYLGGTAHAATFLETYRTLGPFNAMSSSCSTRSAGFGGPYKGRTSPDDSQATT